MKLSCVTALALIPASLAFTTHTLKGHTFRTDSSLNSFVRDLFGDRSPVKEQLEEALVNRLRESAKDLLEEKIKSALGMEEPLEEPVEYKNMAEGNFRHMPTKEMTGVELHICRLAATMARQCYNIQDDKKDAFELNTKEHKAEAIIMTKQDIFRPTNPTFGAAVCGDTMILAWRGTSPETAPMDLVNDISFSPCSNVVWREHAKTLKLQGAMASLCANDVATYEDLIISECKKRGIKEIVTTGHSLGGGIGQCAHTILRAQIQDKSSPWSALNGDVNVRSIVFSAPMTTVVLDNYSDETEQFMDEINENSCNIIFSNDWIPRAYGYVSFLEDFADDCLYHITKSVAEKVPGKISSYFLKKRLDFKAELGKENLYGTDVVQNLVQVMNQYIHPGKIVYYKTEESEPRVLTDMGFAYDGPKKDTFRSVKYIRDKDVNPVEAFNDDWHMPIVKAPGVGYDDSVLH